MDKIDKEYLDKIKNGLQSVKEGICMKMDELKTRLEEHRHKSVDELFSQESQETIEKAKKLAEQKLKDIDSKKVGQ